MPIANRSSQSPGVQTSADGSVDVYFGPKAPAEKGSNRIPTERRADSRRSSASTGPKNLFDKAWVLPEIEKVK